MGNSVRKKVFRRKDVKVLFVGLDSAGKTTLLYSIKGGRVPPVVPTIGYNTEVIEHRHLTVTCWDVGFQDRTRDSVKHYIPGTECIVFVVDSTDKARLQDAIDNILLPVCQQPEMDGTPVLVLANKQDLDDAMDPSQIQFVVFNTMCLSTHPWTVYGVSALKGSGIKKALDWIVSAVCKQNRSRTNVRSVSETNGLSTSRNTISNTETLVSKDVLVRSPKMARSNTKSFIARLTSTYREY